MCFDNISCWLLPHPGFEVTNRKFDGDISKTRDIFRISVTNYVRSVFSKNITIKKLGNTPLTAESMLVYTTEYIEVFNKSKVFPEATILFTTTVHLNNMIAARSALEFYKSKMDNVAGNGRAYVLEKKLAEAHHDYRVKALVKFKKIASWGMDVSTIAARSSVLKQIDECYSEYIEMNRLHDPLSFISPYIIPFISSVFFYIARFVVYLVCPMRMTFCADTYNICEALFSLSILFLLYKFLAQAHEFYKHFKMILGY